jgi:hypothetical protein
MGCDLRQIFSYNIVIYQANRLKLNKIKEKREKGSKKGRKKWLKKWLGLKCILSDKKCNFVGLKMSD